MFTAGRDEPSTEAPDSKPMSPQMQERMEARPTEPCSIIRAHDIYGRLDDTVQFQMQQHKDLRSLEKQVMAMLVKIDMLCDTCAAPRGESSMTSACCEVADNAGGVPAAGGHGAAMVLPLKAASHSRSKEGTCRKVSWAWDPQVQDHLEHSFKVCYEQCCIIPPQSSLIGMLIQYGPH